MIPLWSQIITLILAGALLSLLVAAVLMVAMKLVERRKVPFSDALIAALVSAFPAFVLLDLAQALGRSAGLKVAAGAISLLILPLGFLVQSAAVRWRFHITFGRACLVSLVVGGTGFGIILAAGVISLLVRSALN